MLESIKEQVTLSMAAKLFDVELLPNKAGQCCPACNGSSSLKTKDDRYFKCFKCGVSGSVIDFALVYGHITSISEVITKLKPLVKNWQPAANQSPLRAKAYSIYKENLQSKPQVAHYYMESRGWDYSTIDCGLATPNCLQDAGLSTRVLQQIDLWDNYDYYNNHLIFPVYNEYGALVHYSGRAIGNEPLRWKSSKGTPPIHNYFYNSTALYKPATTYLMICEGVSDCISLMQMGEPVIGQFGVNVDLSKHAEHFSKFDFLVFIYDHDRYPLGSTFAGEYKSWSQMMPSVANLAMLIRKPIYYLQLPKLSGIKDVNDWLLYIDYDLEQYKRHRGNYVVPVADLALEMYKDDVSKHQMLWKLISATSDKESAAVLLKDNPNITDYLFDVFAYE